MPSPPEAPQVSPMLLARQRTLLRTYHRECARATDCEAPLGCLGSARARKHFCTDSQCTQDVHCPEGLTCQPLPTVGGGPHVRYCVPQGVRKEGEPCIGLPPDQDSACAPGLACSAGWCGRPCLLDAPSSCPAGFFCADAPPGPMCRPTCEGRTCPKGQHCIQDGQGASVCAVVHGQNCQQSPCAEGRECLTTFSAKPQVEVWMACFPECGKSSPACPEGLVCDRAQCRKPCQPDTPHVCEPGYRCLRHSDAQPWLCRPDIQED
ncbi:hypothetical protein [Hyalangium rubrum]|uniref:Uncharacterized protein n=1 Tax=Hyalangium rubrum TaxID=3103134 RepID=A0ABU5HIG5_9BACT|nr:hypothetical protein [Hyalangium sp. s54d21]MDY7233258.1 hypothetical protein [Hyalangium sp. s54d21]